MEYSNWTRNEWEHKQSFFRENPSRYSGLEKGLPAKEWILGIMEVFGRLEIIPDQKLCIQLAALMFMRAAYSWWKSVQRHCRIQDIT